MDSFKSVATFCTLVLVLFLFDSECKEVEVTHRVIFDIKIGERDVGSITIALFGKIVPITVANFANYSEPDGYYGWGYRRSIFHRVVPGFVVQGGDFVRGDGRGFTSIYGEYFNDENFILRHTEPGLLNMANRGVNTNGCQFAILTTKAPWLDGKHVVFGKVIEGLDLVNVMQNIRTTDEKPAIDISIIGSRIKEVSESLILGGQ